MSRRSPAATPLLLSSPAPSHFSSPTLYPTHHHSTTPSNTLLTLGHPHSHQTDLTQYPTSCILHCRSLTIKLLDSNSKQQTYKLQHPLHFLPLHFTITASPLHDHRFQSTSHMLHTKRSLKNPSHTAHLTHPFTTLHSRHPLHEPDPFHLHLNKHSRQSKRC